LTAKERIIKDLAEVEGKVKDRMRQELKDQARRDKGEEVNAPGPIETLMTQIKSQELNFKQMPPLRPFDALNEFIVKDKFDNNTIVEEDQRIMELAINFKPFNLAYVNSPGSALK